MQAYAQAHTARLGCASDRARETGASAGAPHLRQRLKGHAPLQGKKMRDVVLVEAADVAL